MLLCQEASHFCVLEQAFVVLMGSTFLLVGIRANDGRKGQCRM